MRTLKLLCLALGMSGAMALAAPSISEAYSFQPIVVALDPAGEGARQQFLVENTESRRIALQIKIVRREAKASGGERTSPERENFIVTPPQMVLDPGQKQVIRLQWIGPSNLEKEQAYHLIVDPVEVRTEQNLEQSQVKVLFRYKASVYVRPEGVQPDLQVGNVARRSANEIAVDLQNNGSQHILPDDVELAVQSEAGQQVTLSGDEVEAIKSTNFIAGERQTVALKSDELSRLDGPLTGEIRTGSNQ